jgi:hypothetical protein
MNKFVDFGKRSVELPAGCKDLIDMLQPTSPRPVSTLAIHSAEGLGDVAKHVSILLEPGAASRNLVITWDQKNYLHLMNGDGMLTVLAVIHENTFREQAVRVVFDAIGLAPIHDEAVAGWSVRVLRYPLPGSALAIEELVCELLRTGYGLTESVSLEFGFWEHGAS